jgi:hypothetical protein
MRSDELGSELHVGASMNGMMPHAEKSDAITRR